MAYPLHSWHLMGAIFRFDAAPMALSPPAFKCFPDFVQKAEGFAGEIQTAFAFVFI